MKRSLRVVVALGFAVALAGCIGLAHTRVHVPELDVSLKVADQSAVPVYIVRPQQYAEQQAFVALAKGSVETDLPRTDWLLITNSSRGIVNVTFDAEDRYIGFPVALLSFPPSRESMERRTIFLADNYSVYRIRVEGSNHTVEETIARDARDALTPILRGPVPDVRSADWSQRIKEESTYYQAIVWRPSSRMVIREVERRKDQDLLSVEVRGVANSLLEPTLASYARSVGSAFR